MKCYKNILHSFDEMKQIHKSEIPKKVYSKFIQNYLKNYTDNSMMSQILKIRDRNHMTIDYTNSIRDYRVRRPQSYTYY